MGIESLIATMAASPFFLSETLQSFIAMIGLSGASVGVQLAVLGAGALIGGCLALSLGFILLLKLKQTWDDSYHAQADSDDEDENDEGDDTESVLSQTDEEQEKIRDFSESSLDELLGVEPESLNLEECPLFLDKIMHILKEEVKQDFFITEQGKALEKRLETFMVRYLSTLSVSYASNKKKTTSFLKKLPLTSILCLCRAYSMYNEATEENQVIHSQIDSAVAAQLRATVSIETLKESLLEDLDKLVKNKASGLSLQSIFDYKIEIHALSCDSVCYYPLVQAWRSKIDEADKRSDASGNELLSYNIRFYHIAINRYLDFLCEQYEIVHCEKPAKNQTRFNFGAFGFEELEFIVKEMDRYIKRSDSEGNKILKIRFLSFVSGLYTDHLLSMFNSWPQEERLLHFQQHCSISELTWLMELTKKEDDYLEERRDLDSDASDNNMDDLTESLAKRPNTNSQKLISIRAVRNVMQTALELKRSPAATGSDVESSGDESSDEPSDKPGDKPGDEPSKSKSDLDSGADAFNGVPEAVFPDAKPVTWCAPNPNGSNKAPEQRSAAAMLDSSANTAKLA